MWSCCCLLWVYIHSVLDLARKCLISVQWASDHERGFGLLYPLNAGHQRRVDRDAADGVQTSYQANQHCRDVPGTAHSSTLRSDPAVNRSGLIAQFMSASHT